MEVVFAIHRLEPSRLRTPQRKERDCLRHTPNMSHGVARPVLGHILVVDSHETP